MSVLIKGMDMPSACNKCQFHNAYICTAKGSPVSLQIYLCDKKPCDCPLAEIPTHHGRLIDVDALNQKIIETVNRGKPDEKFTARDVIQLIENAPTIIEAEVNK